MHVAGVGVVGKGQRMMVWAGHPALLGEPDGNDQVGTKIQCLFIQWENGWHNIECYVRGEWGSRGYIIPAQWPKRTLRLGYEWGMISGGGHCTDTEHCCSMIIHKSIYHVHYNIGWYCEASNNLGIIKSANFVYMYERKHSSNNNLWLCKIPLWVRQYG